MKEHKEKAYRAGQWSELRDDPINAPSAGDCEQFSLREWPYLRQSLIDATCQSRYCVHISMSLSAVQIPFRTCSTTHGRRRRRIGPRRRLVPHGAMSASPARFDSSSTPHWSPKGPKADRPALLRDNRKTSGLIVVRNTPRFVRKIQMKLKVFSQYRHPVELSYLIRWL